MKELSILIPARNEMFLARTIQDILENKEADTEVIAVLDGQWSDPPIEQHPDVNIIYVPESIGQRAATNLACKLSRAKYVMKVDAHCSFDKGFDRKMIEGFKRVGDNATMVPIMRNLWAFDWECMKCGNLWYQGPTPTKCMKYEEKNRRKKLVVNEDCDETKSFKRNMIWKCEECDWKKYQKPVPEKCEKCGGIKIKEEIRWEGKERPQSYSYSFDPSPHFKYWNHYRRTPQYQKDLKETGLTETMSLQGSCWMAARKRYWEFELCDEKAGSWGNQGIEVSLATWLTGGRVLVNHNTWYAHLFRTQGGDFSFPYRNRGRDVRNTKNYIKDKFWGQKHPKQIHPVSWLVEKFAPVPDWDEKSLKELKENENK